MQQFKLKDLGNLKYFLGIEISRTKRGVAISQRKYALEILEDMGYLAVKPTNSPMEQNLRKKAIALKTPLLIEDLLDD